MRSLTFVIALFVASMSVTVAAAAGSQPPPLPAAAAPCANCHGTDGRQQGVIPAIAGRPAVILLGKLQDFRADKATDATVMPRLIKGLTDGELEAVTQYFSTIR
jgi:sulfide dehydrogenase cytochrome subunit